MKRVLAFAFALALAVGAFAPAAFADDYVPAQIPLTDIYADPELYDLYVAPYYNNLSFSDWGDYATDAVISGFPMDTVKQIETTEGGLESLWNTVHNAFTFGYNIGQDWVSKLYVDTSDGRLKSDGNIMTDDLKALLDQYFKTPGSVDSSFTLGGYSFYLVPSNGSISSWYGTIRNTSLYDEYFCFPNGLGSSGLWGGSFHSGCSFTYPGSSYTINSPYTGSVSSGYCVGLGMNTTLRNTISAVFFGNDLPTSDPSWNGDGFYKDEYIVDVSLPALPAIDWEDLNNKYYVEYGGDFVDGDVNNFYYDISYNYYPAEYTYTIPYWLIDGNTSVLDFNYSLELPSVDLYELPSEFAGGDGVWDASFSMLGGFGAFVLLGFSFGLVALFFKD